jgi:hypothetical protein
MLANQQGISRRSCAATLSRRACLRAAIGIFGNLGSTNCIWGADAVSALARGNRLVREPSLMGLSFAAAGGADLARTGCAVLVTTGCAVLVTAGCAVTCAVAAKRRTAASSDIDFDVTFNGGHTDAGSCGSGERATTFFSRMAGLLEKERVPLQRSTLQYARYEE